MEARKQVVFEEWGFQFGFSVLEAADCLFAHLFIDRGNPTNK